MTISLYITYLIATLAFCMTPGPAVLLVTSQAMIRGARAGVLAALGTQAANTGYWTVFSLGLGAVIAASEQFFLVVKYAGAAYLVVLGALTIRNARRAAQAVQAPGPVPVWRAPFAQGLANQLANPKALLFMGVFVPQFVTPGRTTAQDILLLAASGMLIDLVTLSSYGWIAARGGALFRDPLALLWRERAAGAAQIAVGGMIAAMRRAA
jgi:homoserine/homoserine lactone efflux protein